MIRFVYIGDQIIGGEKSFAYFNTVYDKFIQFDCSTVFEEWEDFLEESEGHEYIDRCIAVTPDYIKEKVLKEKL